MALLVAVLLAGGRLASDLEIVAFKSAGVSALRLFRPVLVASLLVTVVTAALTLVVNPAANGELQRQMFRILQARAASGLQERVFNSTFGDLTIYVEDVSASQVALRGILVSDERDPKLSQIITAREGRLLTDEANRRITLADAQRRRQRGRHPAGRRPEGDGRGLADRRRRRRLALSLHDVRHSTT